MGRRILNRKELRADNDASERRPEDEEPDDTEEEEGEEEEEEDSEEDEEEEGEEKDEEDEEAPPKKKAVKKAPKAPKAPKPKTRSRVTKVTRMRLIWGVFNNSNQCVKTYAYPEKKEALEHAERLTNDKRSTHFVQPLKEPIEEKKEKK